MPRTTTSVNKSKQIKATTILKRARVEEAGLGGRRAGKALATTSVAQAQRDARSAKPTAAAKPAAKRAPAAAKADPASKKQPGRSALLIEVRTSHTVPGSAGLDAHVESVIAGSLSRFFARLTRIDVYLNDENGGKSGSKDKHCQIEARPASSKPVSASATADTVEKAITTAAGKMKRLLATKFEKLTRR